MKTSFNKLIDQLSPYLSKLHRYRILLFFILLAAVYGYLMMQINSDTSVQPADSAGAVSVSTPHIDPGVVKQLQNLQDNSVSVQALFNQERANPFQ